MFGSLDARRNIADRGRILRGLGLAGFFSPALGGKPINRYTNYTNTTNFSTSSATKEMGGFGSSWAITPATTGKARLSCFGTWQNTQNNFLNFYYGTGAAPAANAAVTGTGLMTTDLVLSSSVAIITTFGGIVEVSGLVIGTPYWFDFGLSSSSGAALCRPTAVCLEEI